MSLKIDIELWLISQFSRLISHFPSQLDHFLWRCCQVLPSQFYQTFSPDLLAHQFLQRYLPPHYQDQNLYRLVLSKSCKLIWQSAMSTRSSGKHWSTQQWKIQVREPCNQSQLLLSQTTSSSTMGYCRTELHISRLKRVRRQKRWKVSLYWLPKEGFHFRHCVWKVPT